MMEKEQTTNGCVKSCLMQAGRQRQHL